tara:strand:- start:274 stop:570 length:297 start_codon:yes stop_codon:yes gene_type:complete
MAESGAFTSTITVIAGIIVGLGYSHYLKTNTIFNAPPPKLKTRNIRTVIQQVPQVFYMNDPEPKQTGGHAQVLNPGKVAIAVGSLVIVSVMVGGWLKS